MASGANASEATISLDKCELLYYITRYKGEDTFILVNDLAPHLIGFYNEEQVRSD